MTFNSLIFIFVALPIFFLCYIKTPIKKRKNALFIISILFYFWAEPIYSIGLIFVSLLIYLLSRKMAIEIDKNKKMLLIEIVAIVLFLLIYFKYYDFILRNIENLAGVDLTFKLFIVPTAISFISFTLISYAVDVYRGKVAAENFIEFGTFIFFFPKVLMGPIMRYEDFKGQGNEKIGLNKINYGIRRFITGLGKKVILADSFALVYAEMCKIEDPTLLSAWLLAFAFSFQIYFDFSGYSDMAVGIGYLFGYSIPENFNYPYISVDIKDFWKRWHMSLSSWFRDYVYIPLGGSRCRLGRIIFNTFVVWFLTGLWHGSSWNFVIWGLYYFVLLVLERYVIGKMHIKFSKEAKIFFTFILVTIGWVFFSFTDFTQMTSQLKAMIGVNGVCNREFFWFFKNNFILFFMGMIGATPFFKNLSKRLNSKKWENIKLCCLGLIFIISIACIIKSSFQPFLYVQF